MTMPFSVNALKIASPCPASWDEMTGDDRSRLCSQCDKHVYNIISMTKVEVEDLVKQTEGDFCGRLFRRKDGTVLTADCPVGRGQAPKRLMRRLVAGAFIGIGLVTTGAVLRGSSQSEWEWPPSGPGVTPTDYWDWALTTVGLKKKPMPTMTAGAMICPPTLTPPTTSPVGVEELIEDLKNEKAAQSKEAAKVPDGGVLPR